MDTEIALSLGKGIRAYRLEAEMTQEELAFAAGINRNYVSSLELGQKEASLAMVFKIATALGISPVQLVSTIVQDIAAVKVAKRK